MKAATTISEVLEEGARNDQNLATDWSEPDDCKRETDLSRADYKAIVLWM